jgi:hypothetical protein
MLIVFLNCSSLVSSACQNLVAPVTIPAVEPEEAKPVKVMLSPMDKPIEPIRPLNSKPLFSLKTFAVAHSIRKKTTKKAAVRCVLLAAVSSHAFQAIQSHLCFEQLHMMNYGLELIFCFGWITRRRLQILLLPNLYVLLVLMC